MQATKKPPPDDGDDLLKIREKRLRILNGEVTYVLFIFWYNDEDDPHIFKLPEEKAMEIDQKIRESDDEETVWISLTQLDKNSGTSTSAFYNVALINRHIIQRNLE